MPFNSRSAIGSFQSGVQLGTNLLDALDRRAARALQGRTIMDEADRKLKADRDAKKAADDEKFNTRRALAARRKQLEAELNRLKLDGEFSVEDKKRLQATMEMSPYDPAPYDMVQAEVDAVRQRQEQRGANLEDQKGIERRLQLLQLDASEIEDPKVRNRVNARISMNSPEAFDSAQKIIDEYRAQQKTETGEPDRARSEAQSRQLAQGIVQDEIGPLETERDALIKQIASNDFLDQLKPEEQQTVRDRLGAIDKQLTEYRQNKRPGGVTALTDSLSFGQGQYALPGTKGAELNSLKQGNDALEQQLAELEKLLQQLAEQAGANSN